MKSLLAVVFTILPTLCFGQEAGSAAAFEAIQRASEQQREEARRNKQATQSGRSLFNADPRWGTPAFRGTLWNKAAGKCAIGDWGCYQYTMRVLSKVNDNECLVTQGRDRHILLLRGFDMSKVTDDLEFILQHPVWIDKTYTYTTVSGASSTVLVMDRNDKKYALVLEKIQRQAEAKAAEEKRARQAEEARKKLAERARWQMWKSGGHQVFARFNSYSNGIVSLTKEDGVVVEVPLDQLSENDQSFVKDCKWQDLSRVAGLREWKDTSGSSTVEATLVTLVDGTVTLRTAEDRQVALSIDSLSDQDREYIESARRGRIEAVHKGLELRDGYLKQHRSKKNKKGVVYEQKFIGRLISELAELEKGNIPVETKPPLLPR